MKSASPNQPQGQVPSRDAGRALDALVAEKVMGWRAWRERRGENTLCVAVPGGAREPWLSSRYPQPERYEAVSCAEALRIGFYGTEFPAYSSNIAAAWLVVDALGVRGFHARITTPFRPDEEHFAGFTPHGTTGWNGRPGFYAGGRTAPLAICRAALAAVEVPDEQR